MDIGGMKMPSYVVLAKCGDMQWGIFSNTSIIRITLLRGLYIQVDIGGLNLTFYGIYTAIKYLRKNRYSTV